MLQTKGAEKRFCSQTTLEEFSEGGNIYFPKVIIKIHYDAVR